MDSTQRVYFISGHEDLTVDEFNTHYSRRIKRSNSDFPDCLYIIGAAAGTDRMSHDYLRTIGVDPNRVIIYYKHDGFHNPHRYRVHIKAEYDTVMTGASTHDITWVRPGSDRTSVQRNIARRREKRARTERVATPASIYIPPGTILI